jgi:hypothetical protein
VSDDDTQPYEPVPDAPLQPDERNELGDDNVDEQGQSGPTWQEERFQQSYPNAGMTAEERPEVGEHGIEESEPVSEDQQLAAAQFVRQPEEQRAEGS